jgi:hypothetical protein
LTVTEEIRRAKADTINKIKALFPEAKLNNEQARVFRDLAFPKGGSTGRARHRTRGGTGARRRTETGRRPSAEGRWRIGSSAPKLTGAGGVGASFGPAVSGGFSAEAIRAARDLDPARPQDLAELRAMEAKARAELDAVPKDIEHFQQLSAASSKKQWLTEAIEAATGQKPEFIKQLLGEDYQPPFPERFEPKAAEAPEPVPPAEEAKPEPEWLGKPLKYWETLDVAKLSPVQRQRVAKSLGVPDAPKPIREALAQRVAEIRANPPKPKAGPEPLMPQTRFPQSRSPRQAASQHRAGQAYVPPKGTEKERVAEVKGKYAWNPLDIDVQKNEDGTYAYSANIQLSVSGMGGPMLGSFPTKGAAAKAGAMEIVDWLQHEEARNNSTGDVKTIAQIRAALEPLLAPAKESHPATTGPTTAEKVSREEIGDRPGANSFRGG